MTSWRESPIWLDSSAASADQPPTGPHGTLWAVLLIFDDLFAFDRGICHLRVYRDGESVLALAIELDDNPGASIANGAEQLGKRAAAVFGGDQRLFIRFPGSETTWTEASFAAPGARAEFHREVPHAEIETAVGAVVSVASEGASTALDVGGAGHPLLPLVPPEEPERYLLEEMQAVSVADLPWPHNPSRCAHFDRFNEVQQLYDGKFDRHVPAGAHFFLTLAEDDLAACRYHQHDWQAIAAASVTLLDRLPYNADRDTIIAAASNLLPSGPDRDELIYLFSDPIAWAAGESSITNGQHRTCALKASGASKCAVMVYGERPYTPTAGDPRQAARAALAAHWVDQLRRR